MLIHIGHENYVERHKIAVVLNSEGSAVRKLRQDAGQEGRLVNATNGNKTRSLIILDTRIVVQSAINSETIEKRIRQGDRS